MIRQPKKNRRITLEKAGKYLQVKGITEVTRGLRIAWLFSLSFLAERLDAQPTQTADQAKRHYELTWAQVRARYPDAGPLPAASSFQFGMGTRRKLRYENGTLRDARTGDLVHQWEIRREIILPSEYTVLLQTRRGSWITLRETQTGILIREGTVEAYLSRSPLRLPTFRYHSCAPVLRVLHHQVLLGAANGLDSLGTEVLRLTGNNGNFPVVPGSSPASGPAHVFLLLWNEKSPAR